MASFARSCAGRPAIVWDMRTPAGACRGRWEQAPPSAVWAQGDAQGRGGPLGVKSRPRAPQFSSCQM
jgi:hypothetical protein